MNIVLADEKQPGARQCGDCTLCCRLLPMKRDAYPPEQIALCVDEMIKHGMMHPSEKAMIPDFDKPAGKPCPHQRDRCVLSVSSFVGCAIYKRRPFGCRVWNCRWLVNAAGKTERPDRVHYVVDVLPDFITVEADGDTTNIEVVCVWCDPSHPEAWRDPALLDYLNEQGKAGKAALIRFNNADGLTVFPPSMCGDNQWHEVRGNSLGYQHRGHELIEGLAACRNVRFAASE